MEIDHSHNNESRPDVREEISRLLGKGWTWEGDRLTHPTDKDLWRVYDLVKNECTRSPKYADIEKQFDDDVEKAMKEAQRRVRQRRAQ